MNIYRLLDEFDRFIPEGGLTIRSKFLFLDANDVSTKEKEDAMGLFLNHPSYKALYADRDLLKRGEVTGRKFSIWCYREQIPVAVYRYTEFLDSPHGYGKGDYHMFRLVWPDFSWKRAVRETHSDLLHMFFYNGAKTTYTFAAVFKEGRSYWDRVDPRLPCVAPVEKQDGLDLQKYMLMKGEFKTDYATYLIIEHNGDIYRSMDLIDYYLKATGKDLDFVSQWRKEQDEAARKIGVNLC